MGEQFVRVGGHLAIPLDEVRYRFSRSGGPGGQNVNKTATQVELLFDVGASPSLTADQRAMIIRRLRTHVDAEGVLHVTSQATPSQWRNRQDALERFATLIERALRPRRPRVRTRPTRSSQERRLQRKVRHGSKKALRRNVLTHDE